MIQEIEEGNIRKTFSTRSLGRYAIQSVSMFSIEISYHSLDEVNRLGAKMNVHEIVLRDGALNMVDVMRKLPRIEMI